MKTYVVITHHNGLGRYSSRASVIRGVDTVNEALEFYQANIKSFIDEVD